MLNQRYLLVALLTLAFFILLSSLRTLLILPIPLQSSTLPEPTILPFLFLDNDTLTKWISHSSVCYPKTFTVSNVNPGTNNGLVFRCLFSAAIYAMATQRTLFVEQFSDGFKKDFTTWNEFFIPISPNCIPPHHDNMTFIQRDTKEDDIKDHKHIWLMDGCVNTLWQWNPDSGSITTMAKIAELLWKMTPTMHNEILTFIYSAFPDFLKKPYYCIHIRRGDKVFGKTAEAILIPGTKYCSSFPMDETPLFVISDGIDAIEEVIRDCPNRKIISFKDLPDYILVRTGMWQQAVLLESSKEYKLKSFKAFLAEVTVAKYSKVFVGTGSSGVWQLINVLRDQRDSISLD